MAEQEVRRIEDKINIDEKNINLRIGCRAVSLPILMNNSRVQENICSMFPSTAKQIRG